MSKLASQHEYVEPRARGPVAQTEPSLGAVPGTVGATSTFTSQLVAAGGYASLAIAATLAAAGNLSVQRYLDAAGTIPQGAAVTVAMTAAVQANLNVNDGAPFQSFKISVQNTSAGVAALSGVFALLNAQ